MLNPTTGQHIAPNSLVPYFTNLGRMEGCVTFKAIRIKHQNLGRVILQYYFLTTAPPGLLKTFNSFLQLKSQ